MQKIIKDLDPKRCIVQVTIADERWYLKSSIDPITNLPVYKAVPSVTWIAGHYPKGIGYYKWLGEHGWDESQALMREAGDKGSKVHLAISDILDGREVRIDSKYINKSTGQIEELTFEEVECIMSFIAWKATLESFEPIAWDVVVYSDIHNFAGSVDLIAKVNGVLYIIDFKTSQQMWPSHEMQVSAYRVATENGENPMEDAQGKMIDMSGLKTAILQIGYKKNKAGWKWNEVNDVFALFKNAQAIWARECEGQDIKKRDIPVVLSAAKNPVGEVIQEPQEEYQEPEIQSVPEVIKKRIKK